MLTYVGHAYIVDSTDTTVLQDLGDYKIKIQGYTGTTINGGTLSAVQEQLSNGLEDWSKYGGTVIIAQGSVSSMDYYKTNVCPDLEYLICNVSDSTAKIKIVFPNGYYLLGRNTISDSFGGISFDGYNEVGTRVYQNFTIPGAINKLHDSSYTYNIPQFRMISDIYITPSGFDVVTMSRDFYVSGAANVRYWYIYGETNNTNFYLFLNCLTPYIEGYDVTLDLTNCTGSSSNPSIIVPSATVTTFSFEGDTDFYFSENSVSIDGTGVDPSSPVVFNFDPDTGELRIGPVTSNITIHVTAYGDPYAEDSEYTEEDGGDGDHDDTSDPIDIPTLPVASASASGLITLFNPTQNQLDNFASFLWSNLFDVATLKKLFADPMDAILGLSLVPVSVPSSSSTEVKIGNVATGVYMNKVSSQYVTVDCGSITINEYWGAYLDYSPYTKAEIYLPYCGIHPIDIDDIMGRTINVVYHVDILSGACCAFIKCGDSILYSFMGHCSCSIPVTANNWTAVINGMISMASSVGSMVATGGLITSGKGKPERKADQMFSNIEGGVSALVSDVTSMKQGIERSGAIGSMGGMLAYQKPYIILTRPRQALPDRQNTYTGYPSFMTKQLSSLSGYTEVYAIHLKNIPATSSELNELASILLEGVIF